MENDERITIKQMMPIPEEYEVMLEITQRDGTKEMEAARNSLFLYCLILVSDSSGDRIALYNLAPGGGIEERAESMMVPTRYCKKCGKPMTPHMHGLDETSLYYTCECSKEEKTNE